MHPKRNVSYTRAHALSIIIGFGADEMLFSQPLPPTHEWMIKFNPHTHPLSYLLSKNKKHTHNYLHIFEIYHFVQSLL